MKPIKSKSCTEEDNEKQVLNFCCVTPSKSELQMEELLGVPQPRGRKLPIKLELTNHPTVVTKVKLTS